MLPTRDQTARFKNDGYLLYPALFSMDEVAFLDRCIGRLVDANNPHAVCEREGDEVRMIHGVHLQNDSFRRLPRHPDLLRPVEHLLESEVYIYQSRLNLKTGFRSTPIRGYPWHQDFSVWHLRDGMPEPRAIVAFIFLDDVTPCNAPLMVIPRSHLTGHLGRRDPESENYFVVSQDRVTEEFEKGGIVALLGPPGSVLFMHCNLLHASTENISPMRRSLCSFVYSAITNRPRIFDLPNRYTARDFSPLVALPADSIFRCERDDEDNIRRGRR
jgi:ectoine hydroxylase